MPIKVSFSFATMIVAFFYFTFPYTPYRGDQETLIQESVNEWNMWRQMTDTVISLNGAELSNLDLHKADLREAQLKDANLAGTDLTGAKLSGADLTGANFVGATLRHVDFAGAHIEEALFEGTDVVEANFQTSTGTPIADTATLAYIEAQRAAYQTYMNAQK